jgi:hypothetical protein
LIDQAFIDRLDRETAIVEAAQVVEPGKKRPKIARTAVMREMLRIELDRRALARGEKVPTAEPLVFEPEPAPIAEPVVFAAVAVTVERENETETVSAEGKNEGADVVGSTTDGDVSDDRGDVEDRTEEGNGGVGAAALTAEMGPPPERVTPGRVRGTVRKVGVRKA